MPSSGQCPTGNGGPSCTGFNPSTYCWDNQLACGTYAQCGYSIDCGSCTNACTLPDRLYNNRCLNPTDWCTVQGQVFNTNLQTCVDPTGTCPDQYQWMDCTSNVVHSGQPPAGQQYSDTVTYSYTYPYCGLPAGLNNVSVQPGNCPVVTQNATVAVSTNAAGAPWSLSDGSSSSGNNSVQVSPDPQGTIYTITPGNVSGYAYPPTVTNTMTGVGSSVLLFPGDRVTFTLTYGSAFNYTLSNNGNLTITKGGIPQSDQVTVTKTLTSGTTQGVTLDVSGTPAGVSALPSGQNCNPTCTSNVVFTVQPSAAAGQYPITVTGTPGNKTTNFTLFIQNSPDIVVSCSAGGASSGTALVGQPVTWTAQASGGSGTGYTYTWSGTGMPTTPAPTDNPYTITYSTVGAKTATAHVTDSRGNVGTCTPPGSVQINFNPQFKEF